MSNSARGQELLSISRIGTKGLLWLMGLMFAMILAFQYFEIPNTFSLFSARKVPVIEEGSSPAPDPLSKTGLVVNSTSVDGVNSTVTNEDYDMADQTGIFDGNDEFSPGKDQILNNSLGLGRDVNADKPALSGDLVEPVKNSTVGDDNFATPPAVPPTSLSTNTPSVIVGDTNFISKNESSPKVSVKPGASNSTDKSRTNEKEKVKVNPAHKNENTEKLHGDLTILNNKSSSIEVFKGNQMPKVPLSGIYMISDMDRLLIESRVSHKPIVPRWSLAADRELLHAKLQIENAPVIDNDSSLYPALFRNVSIFKRSYELMESTLKVYIYREGERPIFHQPPLQSIYASEGWFMKILESNKKFVTKNPKKAHLFYLPFSSRRLEEVLYVRDSHSHKNLIQYLKNYLDLISAKYPFWNRTGGADHFLVACHDWAPAETRKYMAGCIRALCNSDVKEGFVFGKDVSLPETYVRLARNPVRDVGGNPPSKRKILAFFAGNMHGSLRSILLQYWENKDPEMKISGPLPKVKGSKNYIWLMKNSRYCICAKGYEVNSPRVVEAILYECVPVIISDNFVPPLFEVLNWESFAVFVLEKDIPNLKNILLSIPDRRYREMQMRVKKIQPHFLWHPKPVKYDMFHMILHSIWYNRLYQVKPR